MTMLKHAIRLVRKHIPVTAILGGLWGDEAKGKITDLVAEIYEIVARYNGGPNSGHTAVFDGNTFALHGIPTGILHDNDGHVSVMARGVVVWPDLLLGEIAKLVARGIRCNNLMISRDAHVILPSEVLLDRSSELAAGEARIGSTGRGIGPCYTDHTSRIGIKVLDLLNKDVLARKLQRTMRDQLCLLRQYKPDTIKKVLEDAGLGQFYHPTNILDADAIVESLVKAGKELRPFIHDTDAFLQDQLGKNGILFEGAQGAGLDLNHGTYPYVTSSQTVAEGISTGAGIPAGAVGLILNVVKAYPTRVGKGPFVTELGDEVSEKWCNEARITGLPVNEEIEKNSFPDASVNDPNEFIRGIARRQRGHCYGTTTKRPRRTGEPDLPFLRRMFMMNKVYGRDAYAVVTRLDIFDADDTIRVCTAYQYNGPDFDLGDRVLHVGDRLTVAVPYPEVLEHCTPIYMELPGWKCNTTDITTLQDLPNEAKVFTATIESAGCNILFTSVGPDRIQTIPHTTAISDCVQEAAGIF
jgi:adenylosuccinate synthase